MSLSRTPAAVLCAAVTAGLLAGCASSKPARISAEKKAEIMGRADAMHGTMEPKRPKRTARSEQREEAAETPSTPPPVEEGGAFEQDLAKTLRKDRKAGCTWVEAEAVVDFGERETRAQAKNAAVAKAHSKAMAHLLGVTLTENFMHYQQEGLKGESHLTESLMRTTRNGKLLDQKILSHGPQDGPGCRGCRYGAKIHACIMEKKSADDKGFRVELGINRSKFVEGDKAEFRVLSTRDAFIYLFNVDVKTKNAAMLFPNEYAPDNKVRADEEFVFPTEQLKRDLGLEITAQLPEGADVSAEVIRVIAAKEKLPKKVLEPKCPRSRRHAQGEAKGGGTLFCILRKLNASAAEWMDAAEFFTIYKK